MQLFHWLRSHQEQNLIEIKSVKMSWRRRNVVKENEMRHTLNTAEEHICMRWTSRKKSLSKKRSWNSEKLLNFSWVRRRFSDVSLVEQEVKVICRRKYSKFQIWYKRNQKNRSSEEQSSLKTRLTCYSLNSFRALNKLI